MKGVHGPVEAELTCFKKLMAGAGVFTNTSVVDVFPVPAVVEPTVTELFLSPAIVPFTLTVRVQEAPAVRLTPVKLMEVEPATAVAVPPQELESPFGVATTKPVCVAPKVRSSVKFMPVNVVAVFGFEIVNVNAVELPVKIGFELKALLITGGAMTTRVS